MKTVSVVLTSGLFLMLILATSCGTNYSKEISKVDTLQVLLTKAESDFKTIDTVKVNKVHKEVKENLTFIQKNYTDTLSKETAEFLDKYNSILKAFDYLKEEYPELAKEIKYSKEQLKNMRHDLEYNILKEDQVKEYNMREEDAVNRNVESVKVMTDAVKDKMELFETNNPKVKQLMEQAKNKSKKNKK